jgi:hypothetical protein
MNFIVGFKYKGFKYGWYEKKLYRLPQNKKGRRLSLREIPIIKIGNNEGYRLSQDRLSKNQIKLLNKSVNWTVNILECNHCG